MMSFSFSISAGAVPLLLAMAVLHVSLLSPFAEVYPPDCVSCGWQKMDPSVRPCGKKLPSSALLRCKKNHHNCFLGAYVNKRTGRVWETRMCSEVPSTGLHEENNEDGLLTGVVCSESDYSCNEDYNERLDPVVPDPQLCPPSESDNTSQATVATGDPLECVRCGGFHYPPCGVQLPPATHCDNDQYKSCFTGVVVDEHMGYVYEYRDCVEKDGGSSYSGKVGTTSYFQLGAICQTSGCNFDAERLYSESMCPTPPPPPPNETSTSPGCPAIPPVCNSASSSPITAAVDTRNPLLWMVTLTVAALCLIVVSRFNNAAWRIAEIHTSCTFCCAPACILVQHN